MRSNFLVLGCMAVAISGSQAVFAEEKIETVEVLSPVYTVDRIYKSMSGPASTQEILPSAGKKSELVWIRGYRAVMVGEDGQTPMPQEFMCHSNLDMNWQKHRERFSSNQMTSPRLFTLSQGQFDIRFPDGFGVPVFSDEPLSLTTQVLNLNDPTGMHKVRHKVSLEILRDSNAEKPMKPLFGTAAYGLQLIEGDVPYFGVEKPDKAHHGTGCLVGQTASNNQYEDSFGRHFTGHWVVKPGREENRTLATKLMKLPYDTTIHYIAVHLHPFAESIELRDLTDNKTLFKSKATNFREKIGLEHVEAFSSEEGIPVYKDHEYELVSVYNNTTNEDQDSMAVMYLYLLDKTFTKPDSGGA